MDTTLTRTYVERRWSPDTAGSLYATLCDYIRIPAQSPHFDAEWQKNGYLDAAVALAHDWVRSRNLPDTHLEVLRLPGRTPVLFLEVAATRPNAPTVLLYGHLDKQPPFEGWRPELGPWTPVLQDGRLYGRGGADDGYAVFSAVTAIEVLKQQHVPHARFVVLIEASEESGSPDLPFYMSAFAERIGTPSFVVGLDSGCGDYDRVWFTTSLRGIAAGQLTVNVLREGVHSGDAGGIVPSSFRIARHLLNRLEDSATGRILPDAFHVQVPEERLAQARGTAEVLEDAVYSKFPLIEGMSPVESDLAELILNRTWRPALATTGASGLPALERAGNVMRPETALKLSLRIPPTLDGEAATAALKALLEADPPYGAKVRFTSDQAANGWSAPATAPWLASAVDTTSRAFYGNAPCAMGEGGTIPFMAMLGAQFPAAQFLITGVLGPYSNAHGPNEFLHLPCAARLTSCVAHILAAVP